MFLVGEALTGKEPELAHVDLIIGEKTGPVGQAFAQGLSRLHAGHTRLLAIIRPNLPSKPYTLIVPKVTFQSLEDAAKIFEPAQSAVAKAIVDSVEEGVLPREKAEDLVIICSVFLHPEAKDFRKIYHYNYGAAKLALKRALTRYPTWEKLSFDKDRAEHPIMGFRVPRLWMPPYLQIALDAPSLERAKRVIKALPPSDRIIIEAGTPLVKRYGAKIVSELREVAKTSFIIADLKTLDAGKLEVDSAFEETADGVVVSGLASKATIEGFIYEAKRLGIYPIVDMMGVKDPVALLKSLDDLPQIVILHRGIDQEAVGMRAWEQIRQIKEKFGGKRMLIAVAGGIDPVSALEALRAGADILIVGRTITQARDIWRATRDLLDGLGPDMDVHRVHVE